MLRGARRPAPEPEQADRALLSGEIYDGATITLDPDVDELTVTGRNPKPDEAAATAAVEAAS
jgi:hypothetical protein